MLLNRICSVLLNRKTKAVQFIVLVDQATEKGVSLESIQFYLDFFKFGCPPHGGFGFGLARLLAAMLNQKSIRDVVFLHRGPNRLIP